MNIEQARAMVERRARAWEQRDLEGILADFAPDAVLVAPGGVRVEGIDALRANARRALGSLSEVRIDVSRVLLDGDEGAVEWTWSEVHREDGSRHTAEDGIIFVLRDDKIIYWREYFDTASF
jgi:uncharacterized protein (TIGR02246 family)